MTDPLHEEIAKKLADAGLVDVVATVSSVNPDDTVNVTLRGATVPSLKAKRSYINRQVGDRVIVRVRGPQMIVDDATGSPAPIPVQVDITVSDSAAPAGWQEIQKVWAVPASGSNPPKLWLQRTAPYVAPPPTVSTPATLTVSSVDADTYRGGSRIPQNGKAEQGDYTGRGLCTGVFIFGAAFGPLSGKTVTGCRVTMRRANSGGFTWGPVPVTVWTHAATSLPLATPGISNPVNPGSLQTNQQVTFDVGAAFGQAFQAGAQGVAIYTDNARNNLETQGACTVAIDYY